MRKLFVSIFGLLLCSSLFAFDSKDVSGVLTSKKFKATSNYIVKQSDGFIGVYTSAKAGLIPVKDNREFTVDPDILLSEVFKNLEVGSKHSMEYGSEEPRYVATIKEIDLENETAVIKVNDRNRVIDLLLTVTLKNEVVDLERAKIKLLRVGGVTLDVRKQ